MASAWEAFDKAVELDKPYEAERCANELEAIASTNHEAAQELDKRKDAVQRVREDVEEVTRLLSEIKSDEGWTKSYDKKGITVHFKKQEGTPFLVTKAAKVFPAVPGKPITYTFMALVSLFAEVELMPKYFPRGLMKTHETLKEETKFSRFTRIRIHPPMLMPISNREAIIEGKGFDMTERSAMCIAFKTLAQDFSRDGFTVPEPGSGYTRMELSGAYYVEIRPDGSCLFENIQFLDLKLSFVPPMILNALSKGALPVEFMNNLTKQVQSYENSDWEIRVARRPQIYEDVRIRLEAVLTSMNRAASSGEHDEEDDNATYYTAQDADEDEILDENDREEVEDDLVDDRSVGQSAERERQEGKRVSRRESEEDVQSDLDEDEREKDINAPPERKLRWGLRGVLQSVLEFVIPEDEADEYADKATAWIEPVDRRCSVDGAAIVILVDGT
ncbi:Hypothetical Protein FCC1311_063582 [Hondaea fermentalgiana]|uniref:Uncharacterized protein n=1 Tax=Hondaea fermentalgiana TaxID=2315210 RepID=A0A2R5GK85_9STRA|nr:Hypothetical Protein FCC1311_063582 [Hondaea fermentalgiana]|eukprot:GBG30138.1 Hypothetical Protein FCC1311_063582 [Hondaea fermentalgiana]